MSQVSKTLNNTAKLESILEDPDFQAYIYDTSTMLDKVKDFNQAQKYLELGIDQITDEDSKEFALQSGFIDMYDLSSYYEKQQYRVRQLDIKHGFLSLNNDDLLYLGTEGQIRQDLPVQDPEYAAYGCAERYRNCKAMATAAYVVGAAACLGGGSLVTAGSGGLGGGVALYLASICLTVNGVYYTGSMNECGYDYEDCTK